MVFGGILGFWNHDVGHCFSLGDGAVELGAPRLVGAHLHGGFHEVPRLTSETLRAQYGPIKEYGLNYV